MLEHRHCVSHIFSNWHNSFKGDENKLLFLKAAKAYNLEDYNEALDGMKNVNPTTTVDFRGTNPKVFYEAFMKTDTKSNVIIKNLTETFNGYIINARTKHMIYMSKDIITALMQRLVLKRQEMEKSYIVLRPRIQAKLDKVM